MRNDGAGRVLSVPYRTVTAASVSLPSALERFGAILREFPTRMRSSSGRWRNQRTTVPIRQNTTSYPTPVAGSLVRQNRHDLGAVFGRVVDRLGEKDGLWHITRGALPVDLHRVVGLYLQAPTQSGQSRSYAPTPSFPLGSMAAHLPGRR